ncbi:HYES hydrolase, partial [Setophaga kirtlandii]|nr:HYES hydrolase [Setophaga kirtlandii]
GFQPCLLTNTWVDDSSWRWTSAALQEQLRRRFHPVLESCRIGVTKPDPGAFQRALEILGTRPEEV